MGYILKREKRRHNSSTPQQLYYVCSLYIIYLSYVEFICIRIFKLLLITRNVKIPVVKSAGNHLTKQINGQTQLCASFSLQYMFSISHRSQIFRDFQSYKSIHRLTCFSSENHIIFYLCIINLKSCFRIPNTEFFILPYNVKDPLITDTSS